MVHRGCDVGISGANPNDGAREQKKESELAGPQEAAGLWTLRNNMKIGRQQRGDQLVEGCVVTPMAPSEPEFGGVRLRRAGFGAAALEDEVGGH